MSHWDESWCPPIWRAPDPCVVVTLPGGIELVSEEGPTAAEFNLSSWDGWTNGPDVRGGGVEWEAADGGVSGDVYLAGLSLMFEGMIVASSASRLWELQEELGSILTRDRWGWLRVDEEHLGLSRQVWVARGGRPTLTPLTDRIARYSVQFQSPSPYRLGVDLQTATIPSGGVNLQNLGNQDAALRVDLVGPLTNPGLSWPGGAWQYSGSVPSGTTLQVDMERRTVWNPASSAHSRNLAAGTWFLLPPGTTRVSRTGSGSGTIKARWRSTWA